MSCSRSVGRRREGAEVVVTGCLAERHGDELAAAHARSSVRGFGVPSRSAAAPRGAAPFDLLNLPRPRSARPWAYVKIAEGCDRACGFCAIPTFRGKQRSRSLERDPRRGRPTRRPRSGALVAQDLASYGRDQGVGEKSIVPLVDAVAARVDWVRLLYLYPSELNDKLIDTICATGVPYFDLSLQHVSAPLLRRMRRWGDGATLPPPHRRHPPAANPHAAFRSNFIVGYPGETEADHDELLRFLDAAQLDWCGFFAYSAEEGTHAAGLDGAVPRRLCTIGSPSSRERQDAITAERVTR